MNLIYCEALSHRLVKILTLTRKLRFHLFIIIFKQTFPTDLMHRQSNILSSIISARNIYWISIVGSNSVL